MHLASQDNWLLLTRLDLTRRPTQEAQHASQGLQELEDWPAGTARGIVLHHVLQDRHRPALCQVLRACRRALHPSAQVHVLTRQSAELEAADIALVGLVPTASAERLPDWVSREVGVDDTSTWRSWGPRPHTVESHAEPLVSIIITAYKPEWFEACLRSALDQTWDRTEIVIGDDHPGEDIRRIVERVGGSDPRIRYQDNPPPNSCRGNYLSSLARARGDYIKFLNDDDWLHPQCVERLVSCLRAWPGCTVATSYRQLVDENDRPLTGRKGKQWLSWNDGIIEGSRLAALQQEVRASLVGVPSTVLFRRADVETHHPHFMCFDGHIAPTCGDVYTWSSLLSAGDAAWLASPLSCFRQHGQQTSFVGENRHQFAHAWGLLYQLGRSTGLGDSFSPPDLRIEAMGDRPWWDASTSQAWHRAQQAAPGSPAAIDAWTEFLSREPDSLEAEMGLARARLSAGQAMAALTRLESLLQRVPAYLPAVALVAQCTEQLGHADAGRVLFSTTTKGLGEWLQSREALVGRGIRLSHPHHLWLPVPTEPCLARFRLSHAASHSRTLTLRITSSGESSPEIRLDPGQSRVLEFKSPAGSTHLWIRIEPTKASNPSAGPDILCEDFSLELE